MKKTVVILATALVNISAWVDPFILGYIREVISTSYRIDPLLGYLLVGYVVWGIMACYGLELESSHEKVIKEILLLLNIAMALILWVIHHKISTLAIVLAGIYIYSLIKGSFLENRI